MPLPFVIDLICAAVFTGSVSWGLYWLMVRAAAILRMQGAFPELVQSVAGGSVRLELRAQEWGLALLGSAALTAVAAAAAFWLYGSPRFTGLWMWLLFSLACAFVIAWGVFLVRAYSRWRELRFAARAHGAFAATLARLSMQGERVFHDVPLAQGTLDHVVMGPRGVFAIRLVPRRPRRGTEPVVRINGRSIEFQDGFALLDTIALAERSARALADMQVKGMSHRAHVIPVVAVPGWEIAPAQSQAGETFLANEKTAVLLLQAAKAADYLMDADASLLHEHLARISVDPGL